MATTEQRKNEADKMITEILKERNRDIFEMISKNSQAKQKLKSIENTWKQIEQIIKKELQKTLKGGK